MMICRVLLALSLSFIVSCASQTIQDDAVTCPAEMIGIYPSIHPTEAAIFRDYGLYKTADGKQIVNNGLDYFTTNNDVIRAPSTGKVVEIKRLKEGGKRVVVSHDGKSLTSVYEPVDTKLKKGQIVFKLEPIGRCHKKLAKTCVFHFEWQVNGAPVDPNNFICTKSNSN